jgi:hypothetical protein
LIFIDESIDKIIGGINLLTQEVPQDVLDFTQNIVNIIEDESDDFLTTSSQGIGKYRFYSLFVPNLFLDFVLNKIVQGVQDTMNKANSWAQEHSGGTVSIPTVSFPVLRLLKLNLTSLNWIPTIPQPDFSSAEIPPRDFSVYEELSPFIEKSAKVFYEIAWYLVIIGIVFICFAGLRLVWALITGFVPRLSVKFAGNNYYV